MSSRAQRRLKCSSSTTITTTTRRRSSGAIHLTDSALLQLVEKPNRALPVAKFGDSSQMEPGDWVMAIGNPFGSRAHRQRGRHQRDRRARSRCAEQRSANVLADRRRDQSRQFGRSAAERSWRSRRREYGDLQQRIDDGRRRQHRHRLRDSDQHHSRRAARPSRRARLHVAESAYRYGPCSRRTSKRSV